MDNLNNIRKKIVEVSYITGEGHIASAFSILNILNVLYGQVMNITLDSHDKTRDFFILSKGHASIGLYAILEKYNLLETDFVSFGEWKSILGGHPDKNKIERVEASTGSLGHGFPMAVGCALGNKIQHINSRVFVLVGDGELNEGSMWEAVLLAKEHQLDNICCIIDYNHSTDRALDISNLSNKFKSFGWEIIEVDGHDECALKKVLSKQVQHVPLAIVAHTIKGYGCKRMENNPEWHHKSPNEAEYKQILEELSK